MAEFIKHAGCKHSQGCRFYRSSVHDARNSLSRTTEDLSRSLRWMNVLNVTFYKISDWWGKFFIMSVIVKELSEVGKNLPSRAGVWEPNREKNRYPYILPCKCKQTTESEHVNVQCFDCFIFFWPRPGIDDHCRVRLSIQNSLPHSDYINANFVPVRVYFVQGFSLFLPHPSVSKANCLLVFREVNQRETSSAPRVLCRAPRPTSGGWCGSKMSG